METDSIKRKSRMELEDYYRLLGANFNAKCAVIENDVITFKGYLKKIDSENDEITLFKDGAEDYMVADGACFEVALLLKSTGIILDKDAEDLGRLYPVYSLRSTHPIDMGRSLAYQFKYNNEVSENSRKPLKYNDIVGISDFLRSRGYAMPYGKWSVEELVKMGVYRIID